MTELVEQGGDIVVGQQSRFAADRRRKIAGEIGHWPLQTFAVAEAGAADIHPGAAALLGAGVGIEIEGCHHTLVGIDQLVVAHIAVPHRHAGALTRAHPEQTLGQFE